MADARCLLFVFAKPPVAGAVKTRLAPYVGAEAAAEFARALLHDTWSMAEALEWAHPILATTERSDAFHLRGDPEVWLQGEGDLGQRLERVLRRGLERAAYVIAIGTDSPGLPRSALEHARESLQHVDAVLGPADDGGFYLIGLRRCPEFSLHHLPWSVPTTLERTRAQLRLTPVASFEAHAAAANLLDGNQHKIDYPAIPSVVFTLPALASVGMWEDEAREQGRAFRVKHARTTSWYSSRRLGEDASGYKVLVEEQTDKILSAHLLGPHADELINLLAMTMRCELTSRDIKKMIFAYPTLGSDVPYMV